MDEIVAILRELYGDNPTPAQIIGFIQTYRQEWFNKTRLVALLMEFGYQGDQYVSLVENILFAASSTPVAPQTQQQVTRPDNWTPTDALTGLSTLAIARGAVPRPGTIARIVVRRALTQGIAITRPAVGPGSTPGNINWIPGEITSSTSNVVIRGITRLPLGADDAMFRVWQSMIDRETSRVGVNLPVRVAAVKVPGIGYRTVNTPSRINTPFYQPGKFPLVRQPRPLFGRKGIIGLNPITQLPRVNIINRPPVLGSRLPGIANRAGLADEAVSILFGGRRTPGRVLAGAAATAFGATFNAAQVADRRNTARASVPTIAEQILRAAKSMAPKNTGRLANSLYYTIDYSESGVIGQTEVRSTGRGGVEGTVIVGSNASGDWRPIAKITIKSDVEYAIFQELGTKNMPSRPYIRPAITRQYSAGSDVIVSTTQGANGGRTYGFRDTARSTGRRFTNTRQTIVTGTTQRPIARAGPTEVTRRGGVRIRVSP